MVNRLSLLIIPFVLIFTAACSPAVPSPSPADSPAPTTTPASATNTPEPVSPTSTTAPQQTEIPEQFIPPRDEVARTYGLQPEEVTLVRYEGVEWPNSCLGVEQPGMACLDVLTSGYRLYFDTPQGTIVVHTNSDVTVYHILGPESSIDILG